MADTERQEVVGVTTINTLSSLPSSPSSSLSLPSSPYYFTMTDLSGPLLRSLNAGASCRRRLRYTCSDVSPNVTPVLEAPARYLALGTTSGSVHVFQYFGEDSAVQSQLDSLANNDHQYHPQPPMVNGQPSSSTSVQHYLTIIHEDLIGPVTSVAFAPVQLVVSRNIGQSGLFSNGNNQSTSTSSSSSNDDSSDLESSSTEHYSSPSSVKNGHNGHNGHHHQSAHSPATSTTTHSLYNLVLAIGSSKGSLLIVDIDLQFQQQQEQQQKREQYNKATTSSSSSSSFFGNSKISSNNSNHYAATRRWAVTYQSNSFTAGHAISLLQWDNSSRLFIGDTTGKLFVLHDVEEMKYLMLHSAPKMLLHILPAIATTTTAGGHDTTSDSSTPQDGVFTSSGNQLSNSTIHQVDVSERQLLVSTTEPRVYLYNLDEEGQLFSVGGAKTTGSSSSSTTTSTISNGHKKGKKSTRKGENSSSSSGSQHCSGVTALATYRLLELSHFVNSSADALDDEDSNSGSSDFESPSNSNFYHRSPSNFPRSSRPSPLSPSLSSQPPPPPVKAYRLVSTECTFYATRPKCRLWVVDHQGAVQFTQQYAELVKQEVGTSGEHQTLKSELLEHQQQLPPFKESKLDAPKLPLQRRKKKSADGSPLTSHSTSPVLNFGKLYSMYWRHQGGKSEEDLFVSLTVNSYIVTYSTSSSIVYQNGTQQHHPRLFVIDPNLQVILATSQPIEGHIEEVRCVNNQVFVGYRAESTASLQLAVLTLRFRPALQKSISISSSLSSKKNTTTSLLVDDQTEKELIVLKKSSLVNDETTTVTETVDDQQTTDGAAGGDNVEGAAAVSTVNDDEFIDIDNEKYTTLQTSTDEINENTEESQTSETPLSPLENQPPFTLRYYLFLLRYSIMEQSVNQVGQQTLFQLQRLAKVAVSGDRQSTLKPALKNQNKPQLIRQSTSVLGRQLSMTSKEKTSNSKMTIGKSINSKTSLLVNRQRGRVVDLQQANCTRCHKSILYNPTSKNEKSSISTAGYKRPTIKMYRSCEHIFHSTCLSPNAKQFKAGRFGRCSLCSNIGHWV